MLLELHYRNKALAWVHAYAMQIRAFSDTDRLIVEGNLTLWQSIPDNIQDAFTQEPYIN